MSIISEATTNTAAAQFPPTSGQPNEPQNVANPATSGGAPSLYDLDAESSASHGGSDVIGNMLSLLKGPPPLTRYLTAGADDENRIWVKTRDGFTLKFMNENEKWVITDSHGNKTVIWGDPHVNESDGTNWDFDKKSTFTFGENKVTIETVKKGNSLSLTRQVTIYSGDERITMNGIDENKPSLAKWARDAAGHDAKLDDGDLYALKYLTDREYSWERR